LHKGITADCIIAIFGNIVTFVKEVMFLCPCICLLGGSHEMFEAIFTKPAVGATSSVWGPGCSYCKMADRQSFWIFWWMTVVVSSACTFFL